MKLARQSVVALGIAAAVFTLFALWSVSAKRPTLFLAGLAVFNVTPYLGLIVIVRRKILAPTQAWVALGFAGLTVAFGVYASANAAFLDPGALSDMIFLFLPFYLGVGCGATWGAAALVARFADR